MKVIKKGSPRKDWAKECVCTGSGNGGGGCGAILLVEESDLFQTGRRYPDGASDAFVTFACSECDVLTDINAYPPGPGSLPTRFGRRKEG